MDNLVRFFDGQKMSESEKLLQENIRLRKLCESQQNNLKAQFDLISLQRSKISEMTKELETLSKQLESTEDLRQKIIDKEQRIKSLSSYIDNLKSLNARIEASVGGRRKRRR